MAQNQTSNFEQYQYGALAARLFGAEEDDAAIGSLEMLVGPEGLKLDEKGMGFFEGARDAYRQGETRALLNSAKNYSDRFEKTRNTHNAAELTGWYEPVFEGLEKDEKARFMVALGKHGETLGEIKKRFKVAERILSDQKDEDFKDLHTPEEYSKANDTIQKYQNLLAVIQTLDRYKFETLRGGAVDKARITSLKEMAKKL